MDNRAKVVSQIRMAMASLYDLEAVSSCIDKEHTYNSPDRIAKSIMEMISGCWETPHDVLRAVFKSAKFDEIIYINSISFTSLCAHHMLPFFGKAHFGYLPDAHIVGLSKIPRLVEIYSKRPQIQEQLTTQIVDTFTEVIKPKGCGIVIEAYHLCMNIRGVENESAFTKTTALRGCFQDGSTKEEFLRGIYQVTPHIWP